MSVASQRIVVVLDGSEDSERGLGWARLLARRSDSAVHLLLIQPPAALRVAGHVVAFADEVEEAARVSARAYLESAAARLREHGLRVETDLRFGCAPDVVRAAVADTDADIVVAGSADSVALRGALRTAPVPVLVTGHQYPRFA